MAAPKRGLSNIRSTQVKPPEPDNLRADLQELAGRIHRAQTDHDHGAEMVARYDMDCALERYHGVASEAEFGKGGTAPT